jgi:hypothetical protein
MFLREKFVTNSSSTNYMVYGIWLDSKSIDLLEEKVFKPAIWAHADEIIKLAEEWEIDTSDYHEAENDKDQEMYLNDIVDEISEEEIQHLLLPPPLAVYRDRGGTKGIYT